MAQLRRPLSLSKAKIIQHSTHPKHPLHLQEFSNSTEFSCDGCNALGSGSRYHCALCEFDLHEFCATCPSTLSSHLHSNHPLDLQNKVVYDRFCDLCGDLINGLFYACETCEVDIHPLCTLLPETAKHSLHPQHILKLQPEKPSWCAVCRQLCDHWRYRCNTCCLDIHPECVLGSSNIVSCDSPTRGLVATTSQAQPPPRSSDVFATESTTRALVIKPSQAQRTLGLSNVARGMVAPPIQAAPQLSSGYNIGVPFGGIPMQMNQGFYMNMIQPMMYFQGQGVNQGAYGNQGQGGKQCVLGNQGQGQGANQGAYGNQGQVGKQVVFGNQGQGGNQVGFGNQGQGGNQVVFANQGQGGNQVVFGNQFQMGNQGVLGMQGMNFQHIICHQGDGMNQPGSPNNNNQGGDGKPKTSVKRKIYLAAKIAASVATLATTGVPLGLFLSSS